MIKNFREWLLEQEEKELEDQEELDDDQDDDQGDNQDEKDQDNDEEESEDQDSEEGEEQPQRVFPKVKKKSEKLRDPDKVIKQNDKEVNDDKEEDCDEDEGSDGIVSDMPTGTTSADVATVDNKINLVSRSLHKKLKSKDVKDSLIPTD